MTIGSITEIETFDHDNGTYTVQYKILDASKTHALSVKINGDAAHVKTSVITVVPNKPYPAASTLSTASLIHLETQYPVTVQVFDAFGNPVKVTQPLVQVVTGQGQTIYSTFA